MDNCFTTKMKFSQIREIISNNSRMGLLAPDLIDLMCHVSKRERGSWDDEDAASFQTARVRDTQLNKNDFSRMPEGQTLQQCRAPNLTKAPFKLSPTFISLCFKLHLIYSSAILPKCSRLGGLCEFLDSSSVMDASKMQVVILRWPCRI